MQSFPKQKKKKRSKKKEPERPSIMHSRESGTCYLCMKLHNDYRRHPALQEHHIFGGCPNRTHSGHYGLKVYLCNVCITWQEQGRRQYIQTKRSWICCMKRGRELLKTGSAAGKSL